MISRIVALAYVGTRSTAGATGRPAAALCDGLHVANQRVEPDGSNAVVACIDTWMHDVSTALDAKSATITLRFFIVIELPSRLCAELAQVVVRVLVQQRTPIAR